MAILRRDDWLTTPQGQALAGAKVYYLTQPANTAVFPPTPLATVFSDTLGTPAANPQTTDGLGHAVAYMTNGALFTVAIYHPLLGAAPLVLADQALAGGAGTAAFTPRQASTTAGTITGAIPGSVFTLPSVPIAGSLVLQWNGQVLTPNLGYTINGAVVTLSTAIGSGDNLNANYLN
jgi:hypothetical protein